MPKGSCKRYYYTPLLGTLEMSCNHIKPYNDKIRAAREWYDITPLKSTTIFHRLHEKEGNYYDELGNKIHKQPGQIKYSDIYSANWFNLETYYRGLPNSIRNIVRIIFYIALFIVIWKSVIRPMIGPSGVLIHTDSLRDDSLHESLLKKIFQIVNKLKVPKDTVSELPYGRGTMA